MSLDSFHFLLSKRVAKAYIIKKLKDVMNIRNHNKDLVHFIQVATLREGVASIYLNPLCQKKLIYPCLVENDFFENKGGHGKWDQFVKRINNKMPNCERQRLTNALKTKLSTTLTKLDYEKWWCQRKNYAFFGV